MERWHHCGPIESSRHSADGNRDRAAPLRPWRPASVEALTVTLSKGGGRWRSGHAAATYGAYALCRRRIGGSLASFVQCSHAPDPGRMAASTAAAARSIKNAQESSFARQETAWLRGVGPRTRYPVGRALSIRAPTLPWARLLPFGHGCCKCCRKRAV